MKALLVVMVVVLGACVLDPTWGRSPTRRDPIDFNGMASRASAPLAVQAWNHSTGAFDNIASFTGTTTQFAADPDLFGWARVGVTLPDRYWVLPGAPCSEHGMANLRVLEHHADGSFSELATFNEDGQDCLDAELAAGDHPVRAGLDCKLPDPRIVLFSPAQCVPARIVDPTGPVATIRLTDGVRAWQRDSGSSDLTLAALSRTRPLTATAMARDRDGAVRTAQLSGETIVNCRHPSDGATIRVPVAVSATRNQAIIAGALAEIGLDAARAINVTALVTATCPAGFAFVRVDGTLTATATNAAGATVTSPVLRFTL